MDESGLWRLFFLTGLPEVWLALRGQAQEREAEREMPALSAFCPEISRETET